MIDEDDPVILARRARIAALVAIVTAPVGLSFLLSSVAVVYLARASRLSDDPTSTPVGTRRLVEVAVAVAGPSLAFGPLIWIVALLTFAVATIVWGQNLVDNW